MSEMVERCAKLLDPGAWQLGEFDTHCSRERRAKAAETVRAVIAAMREPTEAMCRAGMGDYWDITLEFEREHLPVLWSAMIDEALKGA